jgi:shikimate dehydrogenase
MRVPPDPRPAAPPARLVLLGHPVAHSHSPRFQQAALDAAGIARRYHALDTPPAQLARRLRELARVGAGGNVTLPHKEAVADACAVRTAVAERVGAVNTFAHDAAGSLIGHNTDVAGVVAAVQALLGERVPSRVVLLGAGGSAAAVLEAVRLLGAQSLTIAARNAPRADALGSRWGGTVAVHAMPDAAGVPAEAGLRAALEAAELVVNATPRGLTDAAVPVAPAWLGAETAALDLVYRPGETAWVRACRAQRRAAEDGLRLLVEQGAAAFAWWFGMEPDRAAMWRVLEPRGQAAHAGDHPVGASGRDA